MDDEEAFRMIGPNGKAILENAGVTPEEFPEYERKYLNFFENEAKEEMVEIPVKEDLADILARCRNKGLKTVLLTNSTYPVVNEVLRLNGLTDAFDDVRSSGVNDHEKHKRVPSILEKFGVDKDEVIVIGDSETDCRMALAFGMDICWVDGEYAWYNDKDYIVDVVKPTYIINTLSDIPEVFEK